MEKVSPVAATLGGVLCSSDGLKARRANFLIRRSGWFAGIHPLIDM